MEMFKSYIGLLI